VILGIVANNSNEVAARDLFSQHYPNKYEALGRYSAWLQSKFRGHTGETNEIITAKDVQNLKLQFFPKQPVEASSEELSLAKY
jgi:hypothetical protein